MKISPFLWLLCCLLPAANASEDLLPTILQQLSQQSVHQVNYEEKKYLSILDFPLTQTGQLSFQPPDTIIRNQLTPKKQTFTITSNQLTIESEDEKKQLDLAQIPAVKAFVISFKAMLTGDTTQLIQYYNVTATGDLQNWQLQLIPKDTELKKYIQGLQFNGTAGQVTSMRVNEVGGDYAETALWPVKAK